YFVLALSRQVASSTRLVVSRTGQRSPFVRFCSGDCDLDLARSARFCPYYFGPLSCLCRQVWKTEPNNVRPVLVCSRAVGGYQVDAADALRRLSERVERQELERCLSRFESARTCSCAFQPVFTSLAEIQNYRTVYLVV